MRPGKLRAAHRIRLVGGAANYRRGQQQPLCLSRLRVSRRLTSARLYATALVAAVLLDDVVNTKGEAWMRVLLYSE